VDLARFPGSMQRFKLYAEEPILIPELDFALEKIRSGRPQASTPTANLLLGPWCNWQHICLSSVKVRVRIPSGPQHSLVRQATFGKESDEESLTGWLLK
jgi:hypothetical protein